MNSKEKGFKVIKIEDPNVESQNNSFIDITNIKFLIFLIIIGTIILAFLVYKFFYLLSQAEQDSDYDSKKNDEKLKNYNLRNRNLNYTDTNVTNYSNFNNALDFTNSANMTNYTNITINNEEKKNDNINDKFINIYNKTNENNATKFYNHTNKIKNIQFDNDSNENNITQFGNHTNISNITQFDNHTNISYIIQLDKHTNEINITYLDKHTNENNITQFDNHTIEINFTKYNNHINEINNTQLDNHTNEINNTRLDNHVNEINNTQLDNHTNEINNTQLDNHTNEINNTQLNNHTNEINNTQLDNHINEINNTQLDNHTNEINNTQLNNHTNENNITQLNNHTNEINNIQLDNHIIENSITQLGIHYKEMNYTQLYNYTNKINNTQLDNHTNGINNTKIDNHKNEINNINKDNSDYNTNNTKNIIDNITYKYVMNKIYSIYSSFKEVKNPKLSIIIIVKNENKKDKNFEIIKNILTTIYDQNFTDIEIIFADDYIKINNNSLIYIELKKFDKRIKTLEYEEKIGNLKKIINSVNYANGEYLLFMHYSNNNLFRDKTDIIEIEPYPNIQNILHQPKLFDYMYFGKDDFNQKKLLCLEKILIKKELFINVIESIDNYYKKQNINHYEEFMFLFLLIKKAQSFEYLKLKTNGNKAIRTYVFIPDMKDFLLYIKFLMQYSGDNVPEKRMITYIFMKELINRRNIHIEREDYNLTNDVINKFLSCNKISDYEEKQIREFQKKLDENQNDNTNNNNTRIEI